MRRVSRLSSLVALKDLYRELIEAATLLEELKDFDATPLQDDLKGSFEYSDTSGQSSQQGEETVMSLKRDVPTLKRCWSKWRISFKVASDCKRSLGLWTHL